MPQPLSPCEYISIHAPREGCDASNSSICAAPTKFQSTHPVRGATAAAVEFEMAAAVEFEMAAEISIHAPREGCDTRKL